MKHNISILSALTIILVSILVSSGCNNADSKFTKVKGTITYNGQAVEGATVLFIATNSSGESGVGVTDASGNYTLTAPDAVSVNSGVVPGDYTVLVTKEEVTQTSHPLIEAEQKGEITYSELQQQLAAQGISATEAVKITRTPLLPTVYSQPTSTTLKATVQKGGVSKQDFDLKD
jgi:hypothetical protein